MAIKFILTDAGKEAMAQVGQVGPVKIDKIIIGSLGYIASAGQTSLWKEIKRLNTIGSSSSGKGIIHVTAIDNSADEYTVREVGLLSEDGILIAVYAQVEPIIIKAAGSVNLLAFDWVITSVPPENITVGDAQFQYPPASESIKGVAQIATQDEVNIGDNDSTIVTPMKAAKIYVKKTGDTIMTGPLTNHAGFIGNASSATQLQVKRAIVLDGDIKGHAEFDGTSNITIQTHYQHWHWLNQRLVPSGAVCAFAADAPPSGWLRANGATIGRVAYRDLFNVIGTHYGHGDGHSTFNVPDLRGQFIRGWDDGRGANRGRRFGSWEADEFRSHTHRFRDDPTGDHGIPAGGAHNRVRTLATNADLVPWIGWIAHSGGDETRPVNVALLYCIKY